MAMCCYVSTEFPFNSSSNRWYLRFGARKVELSGCEKYNFAFSSSTVDITESNEMCSVFVSRSKVLRLHVADWHWKCGV